MLVNVGQGRLDLGEDLVEGGWYLVFLHQVFGKSLARLDDRRTAAGTEDRQPLFLEAIDDAERQRQFRADHGEVDGFAPGEGQQAVEVVSL